MSDLSVRLQARLAARGPDSTGQPSHASMDHGAQRAGDGRDGMARRSYVERLPMPLMQATGALAGVGLLTGVAAIVGARMGHALHPAVKMTGGLIGAAGVIGAGGFALATALDDRRGWYTAATPVPAVDQLAIPETVTGVTMPGPERAGGPRFSLEQVAEGLGPALQVSHAPGDDTGIYVTLQSGRVMRLEGGEKAEFLNLGGALTAGGERGLLSIAFHPRYAENGQVFAYYTNEDGDLSISRFEAKDGKVDVRSEQQLIEIEHSSPGNHNGGQLQFGPDGMLYIGTGDGGGGGDPNGNSQNLATHLGKMLRIDVDHPEGSKPYGIPDDNPYLDGVGGAQPEVWASGLRNPWRFSFDAKTGDLWIGDVGQNAWEEVDYLPNGSPAGANFGWNVREGAHPYGEAKPLGRGMLVEPVQQYGRDEGMSITGGYVYRGSDIPTLAGYYVHADYGRQEIRALKLENGEVVDRRTFEVGADAMVGFGEGPDGELYTTTLGGEVYRFTPEGPQGVAPVEPTPEPEVPGTAVALGVQVGQYRFDQSEIRVPAGKVTLTLTNNDRGMYHNIAIRSPNGTDVNEMGEIVRPGKTSTVTVDLKPGRYVFECTPHIGAGMVGTLIVE